MIKKKILERSKKKIKGDEEHKIAADLKDMTKEEILKRLAMFRENKDGGDEL